LDRQALLYGRFDTMIRELCVARVTKILPIRICRTSGLGQIWKSEPAEMRDMGVRGLLIYCSDHHCSHLVTMNGDSWPDDMRLSELEPRCVCSACGKRGADVRPGFNWNRPTIPMMGYHGQ
jgi:hypothetical protein